MYFILCIYKQDAEQSRLPLTAGGIRGIPGLEPLLAHVLALSKNDLICSPQPHYGAGRIIIPILQIRTLRHRRVKKTAKVSGKQWS